MFFWAFKAYHLSSSSNEDMKHSTQAKKYISKVWSHMIDGFHTTTCMCRSAELEHLISLEFVNIWLPTLSHTYMKSIQKSVFFFKSTRGKIWVSYWCVYKDFLKSNLVNTFFSKPWLCTHSFVFLQKLAKMKKKERAYYCCLHK